MPPLLGAMRLPFLLLAAVCVALGAAVASPPRDALVLGLVVIGALAAHAAVNLLNEWHDFRSGLDLRTSRTPFSGGSGALPAQPQAAAGVLALGVLLLALCGGIGLWLLQRSPGLLPYGVVGLALVVGYTPWITHRPWLCLLAPGLGFGPLMTAGTVVALNGQANAGVLVVSLMPMALASGLLLLNQFPDVDADRTVGRRHLPMVHGRPFAARLLAGLFVVAYAAPVAGVLAGVLPAGALLCLVTAPLAAAVARGARRHADDMPALLPTMGRNVALALATPVLAAIGLWAMPA
ncbi:MAG: prenyltransferase [Burkholderiaceae bacterium]|nr:prenyltransferase [Burkholderiaceae bacterium]